MRQASGWAILLTVCVATAGALLGLVDWTPSDAHLLASAALLVLTFAVVGVGRVRRAQGWVDMFHPLLFPSLYAGISFLIPTWVLLVEHRSVGFQFAAFMSPRTGLLMSLAAVSFTLGCATVGL